jgi:hypothetical protein
MIVNDLFILKKSIMTGKEKKGVQTQENDGADDAREREEFLAWKAARELARRREEERGAYKELVDEAVSGMFPKLQEVSGNVSAAKREVYERFSEAMRLKEDIYSVKESQRSHTFTSSDGMLRIILGNYQTDDYDDTVEAGIAKVRKFIESLAKDSDSRMLVGAILKLISRDQKGNLKASRVMQLRKMANESGNVDFIDGVGIIEEAYRPAISKQFVRAEYKNDIGAWVSVPLGMTEA